MFSRGTPPSDRRIAGVAGLSVMSSRSPLKTGSRSRPSCVMELYRTSASTVGSTQVALGFFTGTDSGDVLRISGPSVWRTSRASAMVKPPCTLPA